MGVPSRVIVPPFVEKFPDIIEETSIPSNSNSGDWVVTSGAYMNVSKGAARTNSVDLQPGNKWFEAYKNNVDCEGGKRPENVFRVISRSEIVVPYTVSVRFKITRLSLSDSPNRTGDKNISLFVGYQNQDNLYAISARHDGNVYVKRKAGADGAGKYTDLAAVKWWAGAWDKYSKPSLLPFNTYFTLKAYFKPLNGVSSIAVWVGGIPVCNVSDSFADLAKYGRVGVRSDFCSVEFDDITIS